MSEGKETAKRACCVRVYGDRSSFRGYMCSKPVKLEVDGKFYCAVHDPAAKAKRNEKSRKAAETRLNQSPVMILGRKVDELTADRDRLLAELAAAKADLKTHVDATTANENRIIDAEFKARELEIENRRLKADNARKDIALNDALSYVSSVAANASGRAKAKNYAAFARRIEAATAPLSPVQEDK